MSETRAESYFDDSVSTPSEVGADTWYDAPDTTSTPEAAILAGEIHEVHRRLDAGEISEEEAFDLLVWLESQQG